MIEEGKVFMGFKVSGKIRVVQQFDGFDTSHIFKTRELDKELLQLQRHMIAQGVNAEAKTMPPDAIEMMIKVYDSTVESVEGYDSDEPNVTELIPISHKIQVVTSLITARLGGPSKNSPKASGE